MSITMETCVISDIVRFSYLASAIVIAVFCLLQVLCRIAAIICTAKGIFAHPKGVYLSHCCDYFFRDWFFTQKSRWKIKIAKYFRMCANRHADQISKWIVQIFPCVRKSQVSWYLLIGSKRKITKRYFGTTVLFKTVLDLLLYAKNVRISYVHRAHAVKLIMLRSLFSWLHGKKLRSAMMKILKVQRFDAKSSIKQYFLNTLLVKCNFYRPMESSNCR